MKKFEQEGNAKEVTRGDQLSGILNKDNKTEKDKRFENEEETKLMIKIMGN